MLDGKQSLVAITRQHLVLFSSAGKKNKRKNHSVIIFCRFLFGCDRMFSFIPLKMRNRSFIIYHSFYIYS